MGPGISLCALLAQLVTTLAAANMQAIQQEFTVFPNGSYVFNLEIGTPPQQVTVELDYGSADLRIHSGPNPCATGCDPAGYYGSFDTYNSSSYMSNQSFSSGVRPSDGSLAAQAWGWDNVLIQGTNISNAVLAVALPLDNSLLFARTHKGRHNLLGLGPRGLEACVLSVSDGYLYPTYDSLLYQLKRENITNSVSFSIWVDPVSKSTGRLLLGAVDESLYKGELNTLPIVNFPNQYESLREPVYLGVAVAGMDLVVNNADPSLPAFSNRLLFSEGVAILDSRQNFSMPQAWLSALGAGIGAVWSQKLALYLVKCDLTGYISIDLSEGTLQVQLTDIISAVPGVVDSTGNPVCELNVQLADEVYLSNKVLQNYYVVVDYDSSEISFAEPAEATGAADIESVPATSTFTGQQTIGSLLFTEVYTLTPSHPAPELTVAASVSDEYIMGGKPEPTRITGTLQINSKQIPNATEASNAVAAARPASSLLLGLLMLLF